MAFDESFRRMARSLGARCTLVTSAAGDVATEVERICSLSATAFDVSLDLLFGKTREHNVVMARYAAMYLISRRIPNATPKVIGDVFLRERSTVVRALGQVESDMEQYPRYCQAIERIETVLDEN